MTTVNFNDMNVNEIYLNLHTDECFIILKTGKKQHSILYESGGKTQTLTPDRMDVITKPSNLAEKNARKNLHKALEQKALYKDNVFGNLVLCLEPIKDWTIEQIINFYPPDYNEKQEGRKKIYPPPYFIPYTGLQAPLWRLFRHFKLDGKTKEQWDQMSKYKKLQEPFSKQRHPDKNFWDRQDFVNYIKEKNYRIKTGAKSTRQLQLEIYNLEKDLNKTQSVSQDIKSAIKKSKEKKKLDKKARRKRKLIEQKYNS